MGRHADELFNAVRTSRTAKSLKHRRSQLCIEPNSLAKLLPLWQTADLVALSSRDSQHKSMLRFANSLDFWCEPGILLEFHTFWSNSMMQFRSFKFKLHRHVTNFMKFPKMAVMGSISLATQEAVTEATKPQSFLSRRVLPHARHEIPCREIRFADTSSWRVALLSKMDCGNGNPMKSQNNSLVG